jgi:CSLREA domain-containing protein
VGCALLAPATASAVLPRIPIQVNDTRDVPDGNIGDGQCDAAGPRGCTLRAAVQEANALLGENTISIPPTWSSSTSTCRDSPAGR